MLRRALPVFPKVRRVHVPSSPALSVPKAWAFDDPGPPFNPSFTSLIFRPPLTGSTVIHLSYHSAKKPSPRRKAKWVVPLPFWIGNWNRRWKKHICCLVWTHRHSMAVSFHGKEEAESGEGAPSSIGNCILIQVTEDLNCDSAFGFISKRALLCLSSSTSYIGQWPRVKRNDIQLITFSQRCPSSLVSSSQVSVVTDFTIIL